MLYSNSCFVFWEIKFCGHSKKIINNNNNNKQQQRANMFSQTSGSLAFVLFMWNTYFDFASMYQYILHVISAHAFLRPTFHALYSAYRRHVALITVESWFFILNPRILTMFCFPDVSSLLFYGLVWLSEPPTDNRASFMWHKSAPGLGLEAYMHVSSWEIMQAPFKLRNL